MEKMGLQTFLFNHPSEMPPPVFSKGEPRAVLIHYQSLPIKPYLRNSLIRLPFYAFPPLHPLLEEAAWNTGY